MSRDDQILDTNVLIIANGDQSPQSSPQCRESCINVLFALMAGDTRLVIDGGGPEGSEILSEYRHKLRESGSGLGEMFLRWLLQHWSAETHVIRVPISPKDDSYEEFPQDDRLKGFDPADHKWVAVANAHHLYNEINPDIVQAADFKWKLFISVFQEHGIRVTFVCSEKDARPPIRGRK